MSTEQDLAVAFLRSHPKDGAIVLERLAADEAASLLQDLPPDVAAPVIGRMTQSCGAGCVAAMNVVYAVALLSRLELDVAAALLRGVERERRDALLDAADADIAEPLRTILTYPSGTAGSLMDPTVLALPDDIDVADALARVRRTPRNVLYYLYVVDRGRRLVGVLNLRELMLADEGRPLAAVMHPRVAAIPAHATRELIVAHPGWREYHAMPVVEARGGFLGAIRYETVRRLERPRRRADEVVDAVASLAELYWAGAVGIVEEAAALAPPEKDRGR